MQRKVQQQQKTWGDKVVMRWMLIFGTIVYFGFFWFGSGARGGSQYIEPPSPLVMTGSR